MKRIILGTGPIALTAQLIGFLFVPVLSRKFSPAEFGTYAVFISWYSIFYTAALFKLSDAFFVVKGPRLTRGLLWCVIYLTIFEVILGGLVSMFFDGDLRALAFQMVACIGLSNIFWAGSAILLRLNRIFVYAWANFIVSLGVSVLPLFFAEHVAHPLIWGFTAAYFLACIVVVSFVLRSKIVLLKRPAESQLLLKTFKKFRAFAQFSTPVALITIARTRLISPILGPVPIVGFQQQIERLVSAPGALLATAARPLFLAKSAVTGVKGTERDIAHIIKSALIFYAPFMTAAILHSEAVVNLYLGPQWTEFAHVFWAMLLAGLGYSLTCWLDRGFDLLGQQRTNFTLEFSFTSLLLVALLVLTKKGVDLSVVAQFFGLAMFGYYLLWLVAFWRSAGFNLIRLMGIFSIGVLGVAFVWSAALLTAYFQLNQWADFLVAGLFSCAVLAWDWLSGAPQRQSARLGN